MERTFPLNGTRRLVVVLQTMERAQSSTNLLEYTTGAQTRTLCMYFRYHFPTLY